MNTKNTTYTNEIKIRDKRIKYRNWKVKDKNAFISLLSTDDINVQDAQNVLVYNCLEDPNTALSTEEFRHIIHVIRSTSISDEFNFSYECEECQADVTNTLKISETIKMHVLPYSVLKSGDVTIEVGDIPSKEFYDKKIDECSDANEAYLVDFLYRVKSWNQNTTFSFNELTGWFEDLDINTAEDILEQWNAQRVLIDDEVELTCSCGNTEKFSFDEIPGFFPDSWFE